MASLKKQPLDYKTQYSLGFDSQDDEIVVDFFRGGGDGLEIGLGRAVNVAKNQSPQAITGPGIEAHCRSTFRRSARDRQQLLRPAQPGQSQPERSGCTGSGRIEAREGYEWRSNQDLSKASR